MCNTHVFELTNEIYEMKKLRQIREAQVCRHKLLAVCQGLKLQKSGVRRPCFMVLLPLRDCFLQLVGAKLLDRLWRKLGLQVGSHSLRRLVFRNRVP